MSFTTLEDRLSDTITFILDAYRTKGFTDLDGRFYRDYQSQLHGLNSFFAAHDLGLLVEQALIDLQAIKSGFLVASPAFKSLPVLPGRGSSPGYFS